MFTKEEESTTEPVRGTALLPGSVAWHWKLHVGPSSHHRQVYHDDLLQILLFTCKMKSDYIDYQICKDIRPPENCWLVVQLRYVIAFKMSEKRKNLINLRCSQLCGGPGIICRSQTNLGNKCMIDFFFNFLSSWILKSLVQQIFNSINVIRPTFPQHLSFWLRWYRICSGYTPVSFCVINFRLLPPESDHQGSHRFCLVGGLPPLPKKVYRVRWSSLCPIDDGGAVSDVLHVPHFRHYRREFHRQNCAIVFLGGEVVTCQ